MSMSRQSVSSHHIPNCLYTGASSRFSALFHRPPPKGNQIVWYKKCFVAFLFLSVSKSVFVLHFTISTTLYMISWFTPVLPPTGTGPATGGAGETSRPDDHGKFRSSSRSSRFHPVFASVATPTGAGGHGRHYGGGAAPSPGGRG